MIFSAKPTIESFLEAFCVKKFSYEFILSGEKCNETIKYYDFTFLQDFQHCCIISKIFSIKLNFLWFDAILVFSMVILSV